MLKIPHNPDILTCLADLSSDEVFTPPYVVNNMLNQLPEGIWNDDSATFLDPVSKSGVFLREITTKKKFYIILFLFINLTMLQIMATASISEILFFLF